MYNSLSTDSRHAPLTAPREAAVQRCTILRRDGAPLTGGIAVLIERDGGAEARVTELTEPGAFLNAHLGKGQRRFLITLEDGRTVTADLVATAWQPTGRRLCRFAILQPAV
jgi:hypothetical protein